MTSSDVIFHLNPIIFCDCTKKDYFCNSKLDKEMNTIFILFMVLLVIASILLVIMVMAQNPKGGGLSGTF